MSAALTLVARDARCDDPVFAALLQMAALFENYTDRELGLIVAGRFTTRIGPQAARTVINARVALGRDGGGL